MPSMKPNFASLSKMAFYMFGLDRILFGRNTQSEKPLSSQWQALSMQPSTLSKLEQSFMQNTALCQAQNLVEATANAERAKAEQIYSQNMNLPHRTYQPALKHDGLEWVATWGHDESGNPMLVGRGSSPQKALVDFDYKWIGMENPNK